MVKAKGGISAGAAVGAAAVAAAAAYWFYGAKTAAKHRKDAASWIHKAREEAFSAIEAAVRKAGDIDKETYAGIAKAVLERYTHMSDATAAEIKEMTKEMKEAWDHIQRARKARIAVASAKRTRKKAVRKARAPKSSPKASGE